MTRLPKPLLLLSCGMTLFCGNASASSPDVSANAQVYAASAPDASATAQVSAAPKDVASVTNVPARDQRPLLGRTILLVPGHGGTDPGALRSGVEEKNITLAVALLLRDKLEALGAKVDLTRAVDEPVPLPTRLEDSNTLCPDLFLSIHVNAVGLTRVSGIETYYFDNRSQALALVVLDKLAEDLHQTAKWSHARDLFVLKGNRAPATLAEIGYLTNPASRALLRTPGYQNKVAAALVDSILAYFARVDSAHGCQV